MSSTTKRAISASMGSSITLMNKFHSSNLAYTVIPVLRPVFRVQPEVV
jgi:hypothetical protein